MKLALFFGFQGRMRRSEWWLTRLIMVAIVMVGIFVIGGIAEAVGLDDDSDVDLTLGLIIIVGFCLLLWMDLASGVKRLHDHGLPGWAWLLTLVPGLGVFFSLVVLGILDGSPGPNRYGPSRKNPEAGRLDATVFD